MKKQGIKMLFSIQNIEDGIVHLCQKYSDMKNI